MGAQYQSVCYASADSAAAAACATSFPRSEPDGAGGSYSYVCTGATATALSVSSTSTAGGSQTLSVPVSFATCDPLEKYTDLGILWGWCLFALVTIWCMKQFIVRQLAKH